jgi:hypothetical protein
MGVGIVSAGSAAYNSLMKAALLSLVLLVSFPRFTSGAPATTLDETLQTMGSELTSSVSIRAQLVDEMMSLTPSDHQPSRGTVARFADAFVSALNGTLLSSDQIAALRQSFVDLLSGMGTNRQPTGVLKQVFSSLDVPSLRRQIILTRFVAIGEEIRGHDHPVKIQDR